MEQEKKISETKWFKILSICVLISILSGYIISQFIFGHTKVNGISMQSTLSDGDILIINKAIYQLSDPQRYDIVLFESPTNEYMIKRIIGVPGDTIEIKSNGTVYINEERILIDYGFESIKDPGIASTPITLDDNEYFMLGDNRNFSTDSRDESIGVMSKSSIIGKAVYCIFPFDRLGKIDDDANKKLEDYIDKQD